MASASDTARDEVVVEGIGLDVHVDAVTDAVPAADGIRLLADVVVRAGANGRATVRVRHPSGVHYGAVIAGAADARLVRLVPAGDAYAGTIDVTAGTTLYVSVVIADSDAGLARLGARVAQGRLGMGGAGYAEAGAEAGAEPSPEPPPVPPAMPRDELPQADFEIEETDGDRRERRIDLPLESADASPQPAPAPPASTGAEASPAVPAVVDAQMPAQVVAGVAFELRVRLARNDLAPAAGTAHAKATARFDPAREIEVAVQARGMEVADGTAAVVTTTLPAEGEAARELTFSLIPDAPGRGRLTVSFAQLPVLTPLAVLSLSAPIVSPDDAAAGAGDVRRAEASVIAPPRELADLPVLSIDESISRGRSSLRITVKSGRTTATNRVRLEDKAAYVGAVYAELAGIRAAYATAAKADRDAAAEAARRDVRTLGARIARELLGDEVNRLLWRQRHRIGQLLLQTSGELDIPWEIVHLVPVGAQRPDPGRYFLGDLGLMRWMYGTRRPVVVPVDAARVVAIAPEYSHPEFALPRAREEVQTLGELLEASLRSAADPTAFGHALSGGFDLLHFAGHGHWRDAAPQAQEIAFAAFTEDLDDGSASYTDADVRRDLPEPPDTAELADAGAAPFVFLSACDVGRLRSGATGLGGFAEAFLRGGAGVFIGCSWAVRDDVTAAFVRTFYEQALGAQKTLGEAVLAARLAAREAGDLTSLAFTVYADPRARLVRA